MERIAFARKKFTLKCPACKSTSYCLPEVLEEMVYCDIVDGVMPDVPEDHEAECGATG